MTVEQPPFALKQTGRSGSRPRLRRGVRRRSAMQRTVLGLVRFGLVLAVLAAIGLGAAVWRLSRGPVSFSPVADRVAAALAARLGDGFRVDVGRAQIAWDRGPVLTLSEIAVHDPAGAVVVAAPRAEVSFGLAALASGSFVPREFSFIGLDVTLVIAPDGSVTIMAGQTGQPGLALGGSAAPAPATGQDGRPGQADSASRPDTRFGPGQLIDAVLSAAGPIAVLQRAGIRDGRLRIDDRRRGHSLVYDSLAVSFTRPEEHSSQLALRASGPAGPLAFTARVDGEPGGRRTLQAQTSNLALRDLIAIAEPGSVPFATDVVASARLSLTVEADDSIGAMEASLQGGHGTFLLDDPDARPFPVDNVAAKLGWDGANHAVVVQQLALKSGLTDLNFSGTLTPPSSAQDHWALALHSPTGGTWTPVGDPDAPIRLDRFDIAARLPIGLGALVVDRLEVAGPDVSFRIAAAFGHAEGTDGMRMSGTADRMPARTLMAFWPNFLVRDVRTYLAAATQAGTMDRFEIDTAMTPAQMQDAKLKKPLPPDVLRLDFALSGASMKLSPGAPAIVDGVAQGHITGRRVDVSVIRGRVAAGQGQKLLIGQGRYVVPDTSQNPATAQVEFGIAGELEPLLEVLRSEGLRPYAALPPGLPALKGQVDARVGLQLTFVPKMTQKDVVIDVQGSASNVSADAVFGKDRMEGGTFTLSQDRSGLLIKGDARVGGAPAIIEVRQPAGAATPDTNVVLTLDEAARARKGIKLPGQVTGPVDVKVALHDMAPGKPTAPKVELDLTRAALADVLPGWTKAAGKPAKATFRWVEDDGSILLDEFALDGGGSVAGRGTLRLTPDGGFMAARLAYLKLSPADDIHVEAEKTQSALRLSVRGSAFDARPILKAVMSPATASFSSQGDLDLDLKVASLIGQNGETLSGADLRFATRGGDVRDFRLAGRLGGAAVAGQTARGEQGANGIVLEAADAGAFFRFFDIYKRMRGGALLVQIYGPGPQMTGSLSVNKFVLEDEPALARTARPGEGPDGAGRNRVAFTKLKAGFAVGSGKVQFSDATMWGPSVGGTLDGTMDFARDRVDLTGTFVPAYGLNNFFNRVPIVGPILGGGQNEGLFAVNFRITGRVTQPTLTINPLSAVAPGFLRKFFGVLGPAATSSTTPSVGPGSDALR